VVPADYPTFLEGKERTWRIEERQAEALGLPSSCFLRLQDRMPNPVKESHHHVPRWSKGDTAAWEKVSTT
jgi:hypothetical protein